MYVGAGLGATAYEVQVGRLYVRLLRFRCWFWPYKQFGQVVWPQFVKVQWLCKETEISDAKILVRKYREKYGHNTPDEIRGDTE